MYKKARRSKDKVFPDLPHMRAVKTKDSKGKKIIVKLKTTMQEEGREELQRQKKVQARHESHQERVKN